MNERHLLSEYNHPLSLRSKPEEETLLQRLQRAEELVREQRAFLRRQEAKVRAAEQQDALEARVLPLRAADQTRVSGPAETASSVTSMLLPRLSASLRR
jgi:hypothetical protein